MLVEYFNWKVRKGLQAKGLEGKEKYEQRLEEETKTINKMGYESYLLVVADFITWAKQQGIPVGPGRGSAAGCLISYCLGITNVDPIKYDLLFERFLNPDRVSMPDIDVDFCKERVEEVIDYVRKKYGPSHVAKIKTFGKLYAKSIIRDVTRVKELDQDTAFALIKEIPDVITQADQKWERLKNKNKTELQAWEDGKRGELGKYLVDTVVKMQELVRNASTHAAGIIIGPKPLVEYMGLDLDVKNQQQITCFEMNDCERLGLIKFDFLSLDTLTQIDLCLQMVKENYNKSIDIDKIPETDPAVWKLVGEGRLGGIFQMGGDGFTKLTVDIGPQSIEDLSMISAIYRPGPMGGGVHNKIIKARRTGRNNTYPIPEINEILEPTSGYIVYQEQIMKIARSCAGYTAGETDNLRKVIGKKLIEKMEQEEYPKLKNGLVSKGMSEKEFEEFWKDVKAFGAYGFNKSHSISYATISYYTAWLKAHYPAEFLAASLSMKMDSQKRETMLQLMYECKDIDIPIMPPDINHSKNTFMAKKGRVYYGLGAIKGLGDRTIQHILEIRDQGGPFSSIQDFIERTDGRLTDVNTLDILAKSGAFDSLEPDRAVTIEKIQLIASAWRDKAKKEAQKKAKLFRNLKKFSKEGKARGYKSVDFLYSKVNQELIGLQVAYEKKLEKIAKIKSSKKAYDILAYEIELLGFYMQGHPLDKCEWVQNKHSISKAMEVEDGFATIVGVVTENRPFKTKAGDWMSNFTLEDKYNKIKCIMFKGAYSEFKDNVQENAVLYIQGRLKGKEIFVNKVIPASHITRKDVIGAEVCATIDPGTASRIKNWLDKQAESKVCNNLPFRLELRGSRGIVKIEPGKTVTHALMTEMDAKMAGLDFTWIKMED